MRTAYVVDDEQAALNTMKSYFDRTPDITCLAYERDPLKAKQWLEENIDNLPDIVFLDVQMKKLKGIFLAEMLKGKTMIVFSTAYAEFAVVSYDFDAADYLLKPFSYERFVKALEKCEQLQIPKPESESDDGYLTVKDSGSKITKLKRESISYIASYGNYVKIFMEDGTFYMPIMTLKKANEVLNLFGIVRIHNSFIVNLHKVKSYKLNILELENGMKFNISRTFKKALKDGMERISSSRPKLNN